MGGRPFLALNVAALPPDLPPAISAEILRGGAEKTLEAGAALAGGHSIQDKEPKYGLIVLGFVDPTRMLTKSGASPGDRLVLTKPIGFGTTTTALKEGKARTEDVAEVITWMKRLNNTASELANNHRLEGGTDITGFSLLGHSVEMADASGVRMRFSFQHIPIIKGAWRYAKQFIFPGGTSDNRLYFSPQVEFDPSIDEVSQMLLFDAQTSGGLLLAVPPEKLDAFLREAQRVDQPVWVIGEVLEGKGIELIP